MQGQALDMSITQILSAFDGRQMSVDSELNKRHNYSSDVYRLEKHKPP